MDQMTDAGREYIAFISYRHRPLDAEAAKRIQKKIENYTVPKEYRDRVGGKRLGMVFRDEDELPASASLSGSITYALDHSKYLLVICTPDLPKSAWCEQEIRYFLQTHDRDHLLAVLVDGQPEDSFSPLMLHTFDEDGNITGDTEPLAANISGKDHSINNKAFRKEIVRIYSALLACPFDSLWQRQKRARTSRISALMATVLAILAVFAGMILFKNREITAQNKQITAQNRQITTQNEQITEQNQEISEKNLTLRAQLSAILVENGKAQLEDHDVLASLRSALDALPQEPGQPYDAEAEALLSDILCSYQSDTIQSRIIYEQPLDLVDLTVSDDGLFAFLADSLGYVRCVSTRDGSLQWETLSRKQPEHEEAVTHLLMPKGTDLILAKNSSVVTALDQKDGSVLWQHSLSFVGCNFYSLSPDGSMLALIDGNDQQSRGLILTVLRTADGSQIGTRILGGGETPLDDYGTNFRYGYGSGFSEDGKFFAFAARNVEEDSRYYCAVLDTENWEILHSRQYIGAESTSYPIIYGIHVENGSGDVLCIQYDSGYGGVMLTKISWAEDELQRRLINKTRNSRSGLLLDVLEEQSWIPMMADDHQAVIFVQESMFLIDLSTGEALKGYAFEGSVISAQWLDRNDHSLLLLTSDGTMLNYVLGADSDTVLQKMLSLNLDTGPISLGFCTAAGAEGRIALTVPTDHKGRLLDVRKISDPSAEFMEMPEDCYTSKCAVLPSPSGDRIFFFYPYSDEAVVVLRSSVTGDLLGGRIVPLRNGQTATAVDGDRVLVGNMLYGIDGSEEYLEKLSADNAGDFEDSCFSSTVLPDGRVLTAYYCSYKNRNTLIPCWLNGKIVDASQSRETGIAFRSCDEIVLGQNGFVVGWGDCAESDASGTTLPSQGNAFFAFDACNGTRLRVEDPFPEAEKRRVVLGTSTPVMVCMDESCRICLLSLTDGSAVILPTSYTPGEIKDLCFGPDDSHLFVLTQTGRLDIFSLPDGTQVFSETPMILSQVNSGTVDRLRCQWDKTGKTLLIQTDFNGDPCGRFLALDPDSWTILAEAGKIYQYVAANDSLYSYRGSQMLRYPFHRMEDLKTLAEAELEQYTKSN